MCYNVPSPHGKNHLGTHSSGPNSCQYANDGTCDEPDLCSSGTDTADCGSSRSTSTTNECPDDSGDSCDLGCSCPSNKYKKSNPSNQFGSRVECYTCAYSYGRRVCMPSSGYVHWIHAVMNCAQPGWGGAVKNDTRP